MTPYSEDALVEQPAIELLQTLGWQTLNAFHEFEQAGGSPLGRETRSEVVLAARLRAALQKLNPTLPGEALAQACEELIRDRSRLSLTQANREVYDLLKHGVRVRRLDPEGGETVDVVRVIDWHHPADNDFLLASQCWIAGEVYTRRPDLIGFVNGLPLVLIELKAPQVNVQTAYTDNLADYKDTIPALFWYNALIILSNGVISKVGSVTAGWEHFADWKKIEHETEPDQASLATLLHGVCLPARLLDLVENFTLFLAVPGGLIKLVAKNHQYLGVNNALESLADLPARRGRLGVFWHTQGSGKTTAMIFFAQKVLRRLPGNWTFVIVTDRQELDQQIYRTFTAAGVVTESAAQATSSAHLRQLLTEDHRYVFTLIHKFRTEPGEPHPVLSRRTDIIVITDEAHRSQYDTLALNMRTALPQAAFLAFTGTPLIRGEEKTRQVFGDYVSIYNFRQSVEDGATVPLFYENRIPELQLTNENLNEDMERLLEEAELDEAQERRLEREFARQYHLITRDDRLETIAADIVRHFLGRGFLGKAMVISIDKATAVRMYDKVQAHWRQAMAELMDQTAAAVSDEDRQRLKAHLQYMAETDMAVVVSPAQGEVEAMRNKGLDIRPHRQRMIREDLDRRFKDPDDPFRLVFVCAMWLTGFDAPACSTLYLDKPMRNHTLMQTIARANRVFRDKANGLIVDYVGVFRNLQQALAIYGSGAGGGIREGDAPVQDKAALLGPLQAALAAAEACCAECGARLDAIARTTGFDRVQRLADAVEALLVSEAVKKRYLNLADLVWRLYKAILPDDHAQALAGRCQLLVVLAKQIRSLTPLVDISQVMIQVDRLLDDAIAAQGYVISEPQPVYLGALDVAALQARLPPGRPRTEAEKLKGALNSRLQQLVRFNRSRMDFLARFQQMIDEYNAGAINSEEFLRRLIAFARRLSEEEQRHVAEGLSEEELAVFDLLIRPELDLTPAETKRVKQAARTLLDTLKREQLVLDWRKRQQTRAQVRITIEDMLDRDLPDAYTPELFHDRVEQIYQHVYGSYFGAGRSVYAS